MLFTKDISLPKHEKYIHLIIVDYFKLSFKLSLVVSIAHLLYDYGLFFKINSEFKNEF